MPMNGRLLRPRATGVDPRSISGVVAYWPMNESAEIANVNADDASGGGMHLTSSGALSDAGRSGRGRLLAAFGTEWNPTGGSLARSVATTSTPHWVAAASGWTVALWVKTDLTYSTQGTGSTAASITFNSILGVGLPNVRLSGGTPANGFTSLSTRCYFTDGTFASHIFTGGLAAAAPAGQWTHLAFVADPNSLTYTIYRNGAVLATIAYASGKVLADFSSGLPCAMNWPGVLDELVIYNRAITAGEVARLAGAPDRPTGASSLHPDCRSWISRVLTNGGTLSQSTVNAVNQFCLDIAAAGIRDRFYRLNLFCGSNLAACLVPLYRGPALTGTQYGNVTDFNTGSFVSGDYAENNGLKGNGTTKYLDTGLPMTFLGTNQMHLFTSFVPDATGLFTHVLSALANVAGSVAMESVYNGTTTNRMRVAMFGSGVQPAGQPSVLTGRTQLLVNHQSGSLYQTFAKNEDLGNLTLGAYSATNTHPFFVFAGNSSAVATPVLTAPAHHRLDSYSIGASFANSTARTAYHNALATFRSSLGRT
jgi:hypothetical protein